MATTNSKTINEDSTYYENVLPTKTANQHQKQQENTNQARKNAKLKSLYSQNKKSEPKFSDSKHLTTKSLQGSSLKHFDLKLNNKHKKESVASKQVVQITRSVKFVAVVLVVGLIVLSVAAGLTIYFMVLKNETKETTVEKELTNQAISQATSHSTHYILHTTQSSYGLVDPAPNIPSNSQVKNICDMLTTFLPKFDFATYGNHTFETIESFLEIRNVYLKKVLKQDRTIMIEDGLLLARNLLLLFHSIRDGQSLKIDIDNLGRCNNEKTTPISMCGPIGPGSLNDMVQSYVETSFKAYKKSVICSDALQRVSSTALEIKSLERASERLTSHLFGFKTFFQALHTIYSTQKKQFNIQQSYEEDYGFDNRQYACLMIVDETLADLSNIIKPYMKKALGNAKPLGTHCDPLKMMSRFRRISNDLMKNSENRIKAIIERWKKS